MAEAPLHFLLNGEALPPSWTRKEAHGRCYADVVFRRELRDLAISCMDTGNVKALRALCEPHPQTGEPIVDITKRFDDAYANEHSFVEHLPRCEKNLYNLTILLIQMGAITPQELEKRMDREQCRGHGGYLHVLPDRHSEIMRAVEHAKNPGFRSMYLDGDEPLPAHIREGVSEIVPDDIAHFKGLLSPMHGDPQRRPDATAIHPYLNANLLTDEALQDIPTSNLSASDLAFMAYGVAGPRCDRNTVINDINGIMQAMVCNSLQHGMMNMDTQGLRAGIEAGVYEPRRMHIAEWKGKPENLALMIKHGANVNALLQREMNSPTSADILRVILEGVAERGGADPARLLQEAIQYGNAAAIRWLMQNDTELSASPMDDAPDGGRIADALLRISPSRRYDAHRAVDALVGAGAFTDDRPPGQNLLSQAIQAGFAEAMPLALHCVDPTMRAESGRTSLDEAAELVISQQKAHGWSYKRQQGYQQAKDILDLLEQDPRVKNRPVAEICQVDGPYAHMHAEQERKTRLDRQIADFRKGYHGPP